MPHPNPNRRFRFSIQSGGTNLVEWQELARKVEGLGFDALVVPDHFNPQLAPMLALLSAAHVTTKLRLATVVLDNDFRHPAVVAKEAATLDVLTDGRFELGLGAGWLERDYEHSGIAFDPAGVRTSRLTEAVAICKSFFTQDSVTFHGAHYHVHELPAFPKPVQAHLPMMIGGRNRRMLTFAAREADIVGIQNHRWSPDAVLPPFEDKVAWVRAAAGDRYEHIQLHAMALDVAATDRPADMLEQISQERRLPLDYLRASPAVLAGTTASIVEQILMWRERCDISYYVFGLRDLDTVAPIVAELAGQ